ncbi:uncharacterized protein LOC133911324 [Phragmites australis]|uniref:uncharacterized protein LOC133911324 n=1 Tax=Phragmites australis TaxID=29695 RepID=UPI002D79C62D|nr:uncharacterized protein LOC133911324 [Phragmites australis]
MEDQDVWEVVELATSAVVDEKKDKKARSHLFQVLPEDLLMQVARKKTAKDVWACLKTRFVGVDHIKNMRVQTLKGDFNTMHMQEGEMLDQYAGKLNVMSVRYTNTNLGETLDDTAVVKKLFDTVPYRLLSLIAGIEQFYDHDKLPFEETVGRLKAFEERAHPHAFGNNNNGDDKLLLTQDEWQARQNKDGSDSSSGNKGKYHSSADSNRGWGGHGCGRGHGRGYCGCRRCRRRWYQDCSEGWKAMLLNEEKLKPKLHDTTERGSSSKVYYLDNEASNHMTGDKEKFRELDEGVTGKVKFGDDSTLQIMGLGSVVFSCKNGDQ